MRKIPSIAEEGSPFERRERRARELLLYVEDDDENWDVAELRLGASYTMLRAKSSEQACRVVRERGKELTAILMDIELRGSELDGTELVELFRGKRLSRELPAYARDLSPVTRPIIFVTAHGARYSDVELMLFGADRVIAKPVNFAALTMALASLQVAHSGQR